MKEITIIMPFSDVEKPGEWRGHPALEILHNYLKKRGIKTSTFDFNEIFYKEGIRTLIKEVKEEAQKQVCIKEKKEVLTKEEFNVYIKDLHLIKIVETYNEQQKAEFFKKHNDLYEVIIGRYDLLRDMKNQDVVAGEILFSALESVKGKRIYAMLEQLIIKNLENKKREFFFITIPTKTQLISALMIAKILRKEGKKHITIGGPFVTLTPKEELDIYVEKGFFDAYVQKEAEENAVSIAKELFSGKRPKGLFHKVVEHQESINDEIIIEPSGEEPTRIVISKGCFWGKCTFCDYKNLNLRFEMKKIDVLMQELEFLIKKKQKKHFFFITDALPAPYAVALSKKILEKRWDITWGARFMKIDKLYNAKVFKELEESGFDFQSVDLGVDSLSDKALKRANKGYDKKTIIHFFEEVRKAGITLKKVNIVYDLPGTSYKEALKGLAIIEEYIDLYTRIAPFRFHLTTSSEMGEEPGKFKLKIIENKEKEKTNLYFCNHVQYIDEEGMNDQERNSIARRYLFIYITLRIWRAYPHSNKRILNKMKKYNPKENKLFIKIPEKHIIRSQFDEEGKKNEKIFIIHGDKAIFDDNILFLQKYFSQLQSGRWYELAEINEQIQYKDSIKAYLGLQKIYMSIRTLLGKHYFDDIKIVQEIKQ